MSLGTQSQLTFHTPSDLLQKMSLVNTSRNPKVTFPLPQYPKQTGWQHGKVHDQRQFGGARDNGIRRHAGVDLEAPIGTSVLAMADGMVLRTADFYDQTWEVTVLHPGVGIIRYGEVDNHSIQSVRHRGIFVRQGQPIAKVGQRMTKGVPNPRAMLHLEWFTDAHLSAMLDTDQPNALSQGPKGTLAHPTFRRRGDLKDPTELLESLPLFKAEHTAWPEHWPEAWPDHLTLSNHILALAGKHPSDTTAVQTLLRTAPIFRADA